MLRSKCVVSAFAAAQQPPCFSATGAIFEIAEVGGTVVRRGVMLDVAPDALHPVQLLGVGRQVFERDCATRASTCWDTCLERCAGTRSRMSSSLRPIVACGVRIAPGNRRQLRRHYEMPAMTANCFQLKRYCRTGVWPRAAQVRARQRRSESPDSLMKTITRPCRAAGVAPAPSVVARCPSSPRMKPLEELEQ